MALANRQLEEIFLSTPSARRATQFRIRIGERLAFLSTPSARRATQAGVVLAEKVQISIHALREEGDWYAPFRQHSPFHISIHALREEGD